MSDKNKVNLFIVGAPKSGTTSLFSYLSQHSQVVGGSKKEPHYFCHDFKNFRWFLNEHEYEENYKINEETKYSLDASVMYFYSKVAPKEIFKYNPNAKIIIILRNEKDFYRSFHNQNLYNRDESIHCPNKAWHMQYQRKNGLDIPKDCRESNFLQYKEMVNYKDCVQRYYDVFNANQILLIPFSSWSKQVSNYQKYIFEWLEISPNESVDFVKENGKRQHKYKWLSHLTNQPSKSVLIISKIVKKILGIKRMKLAQKLRTLNTVEAEYIDLDDSVIREIDEIAMKNKAYLDTKYLYL